MMLLTLHNLAESYKMLPSEALMRATTFDLHVLDLHFKYNNYLASKNEDKGSAPKVTKHLTQQQMKDMIARAKQIHQERLQSVN